jgi:hypothetical protein
MILVALALISAAAPDPVTPPPVVSTVKARKGKARPRRVAAVPRLTLAAESCAGSCARDPNLRYRVASESSVYDAKLRAVSVERMACGITGAPVCPSKPRLSLRAPIDTY